MSEFRVRFAPSPTGFLHVGGARTAIFNWLLARRHGGTFILRVEDTDAERSSEEMVRAILDGMSWLGLDTDEGPYFQSGFRDRHVADARGLVDAGNAYRCFCSPESLKAARAAAPKGGRDWAYPRTCRAIPPDASRRRADAGEPFAVRFLVPEEDVTWDDGVHGPTSFSHRVLEDFILLRSDGSPTYNLSVVSDDAAMRISHVVRGDDHISNTPKQILLYRALGRPVPSFAHLPLILGGDRKRLSKRHGAVSVLEYRERGYLPEAMLNFLALLGWSPGDDRTLLTRDELIERFDLSGCGRSGAMFDLQKLDWLNGQLLGRMPAEALLPRLRSRLESAGLWRDDLDEASRRRVLAMLDLLKERARTLDDFVERGRTLLDPSDDFPYDPKAEKKHLGGDGLGEAMAALAAGLRDVPDWTAGPLEAALRAVAEGSGLGAGKLIHPTRVALTGQGVSPGLFEVMEALGRERSLARIERLIVHLGRRGPA